jgi:uncharacterized protein (DUF1778 family)
MYASVVQMPWPEKYLMTTSVLSIRVSEEERALLEAASELAGTTLSEFIRRKAVEAAEAAILERRIVTIPAEDWEAFDAWTKRPAEEIEGLKDLVGKAPTWRT